MVAESFSGGKKRKKKGKKEEKRRRKGKSKETSRTVNASIVNRIFLLLPSLSRG
jgi:hypothetical protein